MLTKLSIIPDLRDCPSVHGVSKYKGSSDGIPLYRLSRTFENFYNVLKASRYHVWILVL